jgi:CubicO group peptidase (beta-lactamase class C family)
MRRLASQRLVVVALAAYALTGCGSTGSQLASDRIERVAGLLDSLARDGRFSGVVLVADGGEVVHHKAYGFADFERREPLRTDAAFEVGSISKTFTAVAIHLLADRGQLSLDDPLTKFFPALPYRTVTVGGLLSHTSGLFDVYENVEMRNQFYAFYNGTEPYTNKDYLAYLEEYQPPLLGGPNEQFRYSNTGYVLLALIVEQVSGQRFDEFLRREIFEPAGMRHSLVYSFLDDGNAAGLVTGYRREDDGTLVPVTGPNAAPSFFGLTYGDDEIVTTARDLLAYDRALRTGRLLSPETLERVLTPPTLTDGTIGRYGLGFAVGTEGGIRYVSHGGSTAGFLAYCKFSTPDNDNTIIVLTNVTTRGSAFRALHQAIRLILRGESRPIRP